MLVNNDRDHFFSVGRKIRLSEWDYVSVNSVTCGSCRRRSLFSNNCPPLLHTISQINIGIALFYRWFLFHPVIGTNPFHNSWPWHCSEGGPKSSFPSCVQPCKSGTYQLSHLMSVVFLHLATFHLNRLIHHLFVHYFRCGGLPRSRWDCCRHSFGHDGHKGQFYILDEYLSLICVCRCNDDVDILHFSWFDQRNLHQ